MKKNTVACLSTIKHKKKKIKRDQMYLIRATIHLTQNLNSIAFPFPLELNRATERLSVSRKLLKFYWLAIFYKLAQIIILTTFGLLSLFSEKYKSDTISAPILVVTVIVRLAALLADLTFIYNAHEIVPSFSWSYQMLKINLEKNQIGKTNK